MSEIENDKKHYSHGDDRCRAYVYYSTTTYRFNEPKITCYECKEEISSNDGPVYADCDDCLRKMHVSCLELPEVRHIPHFSDKIHGYSVENSRKIQPQETPPCHACGEEISIRNCPWYAYCVKCQKFLHQSCIELPQEISDHPLHPYHNPFSLAYKGDSECSACGMYSREEGLAYCCSKCEFLIDFKCAMLLNPLSRDTVREHQLSIQKSPHWHPVILCKRSTKYWFKYSCGACGVIFEKNGDESYIYVCLQCRLVMHITCVGFPQRIANNLFLPTGSKSCPLIFELYHKGFKCHACHVLRKGVSYICTDMSQHAETAMRVDFQCALLTKRRDSKSLKDEFPMLEYYDMSQLPRNKFHIDCHLCKKPFKDIVSYWPDMWIFVHKSCAELDYSIQLHPFHTQHPLDYRERNTMKRVFKKCQACHEYMYSGHPRYEYGVECECCDFTLCIRCSRKELYPLVEDGFNHQHSLSFFNFKPPVSEFKCNRCLQEISTHFFRCVICDYNLHAHCLSNLPPALKHNHLHTLTLTYLPIKDNFPDDDNDETAEFYCDCCEEIRDRRHPTYHCAQCHYVAHVHCVATQVIDYLQKAPTPAEQLSEMEPDTTTTNFLMLRTLLPLQVRHGFHLHHTLTLSDSLDIGEKKRFRCSICFKKCYNLAYVCDSCEFYVDLQCACLVSSPIIKAFFHDHPFEFVSIQPYNSPFSTFDGPYLKCLECSPFSCMVHIRDCRGKLEHTVDHHTHKQHPLIYKSGCELGKDLRFICDICRDWGHTSDPSYECDLCKYLAHVRCVIDNEVAARCLGEKELQKPTGATLDEEDVDAKDNDDSVKLLKLFELDKVIVTYLAEAQQLKLKQKEATVKIEELKVKIEELKEETVELVGKIEESKVSRSQLTACTSTTLTLLHQKKIQDVFIEFEIKEDAQNIACEEDQRIEKLLGELEELKQSLAIGLSSRELAVQQSK